MNRTTDTRATSRGASSADSTVKIKGGNQAENIKPEFRTGTNVSECATCEEWFTSVSPFDLHRVGDWENRRCLSPAEMEKIGMRANQHGVWMTGTATSKGTGDPRRKGKKAQGD